MGSDIHRIHDLEQNFDGMSEQMDKMNDTLLALENSHSELEHWAEGISNDMQWLRDNVLTEEQRRCMENMEAYNDD